MVVHTASHTLVHHGPDGRLLGPRVDQVPRLIAAVHGAARQPYPVPGVETSTGYLGPSDILLSLQCPYQLSNIVVEKQK